MSKRAVPPLLTWEDYFDIAHEAGIASCNAALAGDRERAQELLTTGRVASYFARLVHTAQNA